MNAIRLVINSVHICRFSARDGSLDIVINFNDGQDKEITKSIIVTDPDRNAEAVIEEICKLVKNTSNRFDGNTVLGKDIKLMFERKDDIVKKLANFLRDAHLKVESVRNKKSSEGYLDMIRRITSMKLSFL